MAGSWLLEILGHRHSGRAQPRPPWLSPVLALVVAVIGALALGALCRSGTLASPTGPGSTRTSSVPKPLWYASAWKLRRPIIVENGAAQSLRNYQVRVSLPSAFDYSDTASTGSDVRFTDSDGTSALHYWKEAFDSQRRTGVFWVKLPLIRAQSSKTIYIYYGNPAAASQSDGLTTFPFFEDFRRSAWTILPDMPVSTADASAAVINGRFYIIGGYGVTPNDPLGTNYEFDPRTNAYSPRSPIPTPRWGAISVGVGTKVYVFGGSRFSETTPIATTEVYDTQADSWAARAPAPKALAQEGVTGCTDGIHVFLFANGVGYRYDVRTDSYSPLPPMPSYVTNWASCGYYKGRIFVIGGLSYDRDVKGTTQIYDIRTNHWSTGSRMPFATYGSVRENPIVGNTMYILQGQRGDGEFSSMAYAYDLSSNSWSDRSLGPHAADGVAGGVSDGRIFTFGGRQDLSGPYGLNYASVYGPAGDHGSAWRQVTGGFEIAAGALRRMAPLRGADYRTSDHGPRSSQLQTEEFQTAGDFVLEARTSQVAAASRPSVPTISWNSVGVEIDPANEASGVAGCQIAFNDQPTTATSAGNMPERASVVTSLASVSPTPTGAVAYSLSRSSGDLLLTENDRPVLHRTDQSCRSGKGFVSIQTAGDKGASWLNLFVRSYSPIEPLVRFPGWVG